jgi:hypothetical protein
MTTTDLEWLNKIRDEANEDRVGKVSMSTILADLIDWAREEGYKYQG